MHNGFALQHCKGLNVPHIAKAVPLPPFIHPPSPEIANMPRYFFNTRLGDDLVVDPDGQQLRDPDQAWEKARAMIQQLLKTEGTQADLLTAALEVTDEAGEIVLEFPFSEALLEETDISATRH
jgi:hypothetical protein